MATKYSPFYKKFSMPFNIDEIINKKAIDMEWFIKYQNLIEEVYLPAIMFKLDYDAHEGTPVQGTPELLNFLKELSEKTNIKLCIIYNNIFISEEEEDRLIQELEDYIERDNAITNFLNIDTLVVPSIKWLKFKKYNIKIKNTVVNQPSFKSIKDGIYDEYDMIYIHDEVIHNVERFKKLKLNNPDRKFGCVINFFECRADCPFKNQHYKDFLTYDGKESQNQIDSYCPAFHDSHINNILKGNSIARYYSSYLKYVDVLDIFKLQGRRDSEAFRESYEIIEDIYDEREYFRCNPLNEYLTKINQIRWKNEILNCSGMCVACTFCDDLPKLKKT